MPQFYEYPDPDRPTFNKTIYVFDENDAIDILLTKKPQSIVEMREFAADYDVERSYGDAINFKAFIDSEPLDWSDPEVMMAIKEIAERFYDNFHSEYKTISTLNRGMRYTSPLMCFIVEFHMKSKVLVFFRWHRCATTCTRHL